MENCRMLRKRDFTKKKVFACIVSFSSKSNTTFSGRRMLNARMAWGGASTIRNSEEWLFICRDADKQAAFPSEL